MVNASTRNRGVWFWHWVLLLLPTCWKAKDVPCLAIGFPLGGTRLKGARHLIVQSMTRNSLTRTSISVSLYLVPGGEQDDSASLSFRAMLPQEPIQSSPKSQYYYHEDSETPLGYRNLLLRYLKNQPKVATFNMVNSDRESKLSPVEFCIKDRDSPWSHICRLLPATRLFFVVSKWTCNDIDPSSLSHCLKNAKSVWTELGNSENPPTTSTFRVSYLKSGTSPRGRRRNQPATHQAALSNDRSPGDTTIQQEQLATHAIDVAKCISQTMGWIHHTDKDTSNYPTFSFHLRCETQGENGRDVNMYSLELLVLDRLWPLRDTSSKTVNPKRIESFVVARSAKIEPGQVVWDPFCQRGTFLVEAAKF
jgi:hypothetical protein